MDIDELDALLLDDYDPFSKTDDKSNNDPKEKDTTFDPLAATTGKRSNDDGPSTSKRRKFKKLDADLLLDAKGLPRLRHETPWLKFQGKGFEDDDLRKLIDYYTVWAHSLYPRLQIRDFARMVMKATGQARVKYTLSQWQDEYYEKQNALNENDPDKSNQDDEDDEEEAGPAEETNVPVENNSNSEDDDSDEDNELFLDYLTGVRTNVEDTPPTTTTDTSTSTNSAGKQRPTQQSKPSNAAEKPDGLQAMSDDDDNDEDYDIPIPEKPREQLQQHSSSSIEMDKHDENIHKTDDDDDDEEDEPLFFKTTNKPRRRITDDDSEMSE
ncbi:replication fork protection component Swi3-domain-containing protein [Zychaea mexicana]|uniref:replication fork protection component Swi3-domain-containing protein n=1 Tax=Zychaea mexicana TaxID=64656 RepID=UPI0022FED75B|nr:replication fork protection component Swi3-domain-containing protein [Zychaea mexicana]KAI9499213.1 replication fork protection component Swi3-domain-containing protein [Zychaea mexicana]